MKYFVYPYKQASESAKALAEELGGKRILREGSSYVYKSDHLLINWGASDCPYPEALNKNVTAALDKKAFFTRLAGKGITPKFAFDQVSATCLSFPVFCRTQLRGRDGAGIVIAESIHELVNAPLYVEGIDKTSEYRVHVGRFHDGVIQVLGQQKKTKAAIQPTDVDPRVWVGDSVHFVWTVNGEPVNAPAAVVDIAHKAFAEFPELSFGAFDIVHDNSSQTAFAIELNSAPMATPKTTAMYAQFFRDYAQKVGLQPSQSEAPIALEVTPLDVGGVTQQVLSGQLPLNVVIQGYINSLEAS